MGQHSQMSETVWAVCGRLSSAQLSLTPTLVKLTILAPSPAPKHKKRHEA